VWVRKLNSFLAWRQCSLPLAAHPPFSPTFSITKSGTIWLSHKILTQKPYKNFPNFSRNTPSPPSPVTLDVKGQPLRSLLHSAYIFHSWNANVTVHMNMQEEEFEKKVSEQTVHWWDKPLIKWNHLAQKYEFVCMFVTVILIRFSGDMGTSLLWLGV